MQLPVGLGSQPSEARQQFDEKLAMEQRCAEHIPGERLASHRCSPVHHGFPPEEDKIFCPSCSWIMYLMMAVYHPYLAPGLAEMEAAWEKEKAKESPDLNAKYSYAFVLCKSGSDRHQVMGIRLMQGKEEEHQQQQEKV